MQAPSSAPGTPRRVPTGARPRPLPPARSRAGSAAFPCVVAVVVSVLLIGGGGIAIAYGVATATAFITGNQTGTDRLVGEVTVEDQGVSTTVHRVEHTQDFTRVELTVVNGLANTITLPVFGNATLSAADGTSLGGDPSAAPGTRPSPPARRAAARSCSPVTSIRPGRPRPCRSRRSSSRASTVRRRSWSGTRCSRPSNDAGARHPAGRGIRSERDAEAPLAGGLDLRDLGAAHDGTGRSLGEPVEHRAARMPRRPRSPPRPSRRARFVTQPETPIRCASSRAVYRKPTPWTSPCTITRLRITLPAYGGGRSPRGLRAVAARPCGARRFGGTVPAR